MSEKTVRLPSSIQQIKPEAFLDNKDIESVVIPDSVTAIGDAAFAGCSSLQSVVIPDSVTTIGAGAFQGCRSLKSVAIPDSVTAIGYQAFYGCSSLQSVVIPDSVTTIESYTFFECSSLQSVAIPDSVTTIGADAFGRCSSLQFVVIPESVTAIDRQVFFECSSLQSVAISDSVTTIGAGAFCRCSSLQSVAMPDSVTTIGASAFQGCSSLQSVAIPDSVTAIKSNVFENCHSLELIVVNKILEPISVDDSLSKVKYVDNVKQWRRKELFDNTAMGKMVSEYDRSASDSTVFAVDEPLDGDDLQKYLKSVVDAEVYVRSLIAILTGLDDWRLKAQQKNDMRLKQSELESKVECKKLEREQRSIKKEICELKKRANDIDSTQDPEVFLEMYEGDVVSRVGDFALPPSDLYQLREFRTGLKPPEKPIYETPGFFNRKKVEKQNTEIRETYEAALQAYHKAIEESDTKYEKTLQRYRELWRMRVIPSYKSSLEKSAIDLNERLSAIQQSIDSVSEISSNSDCSELNFLDSEIQKAEDALKEAMDGLTKLYSSDVIYSKYRGLVPVCSFLEYYETGRCAELKGPSGAYNLYESEIRADAIIDKLDVIESRLESIQNNQFEVISQLKRINSNISTLESKMIDAVKEMRQTNEHLDAIKAINAATAHYAKATAYSAETAAYYTAKQCELLDSIGYMTAFCAIS